MDAAGSKHDSAATFKSCRSCARKQVRHSVRRTPSNLASLPSHPTISIGKTNCASQLKNAPAFRQTRLRAWKRACVFPAPKLPIQKSLAGSLPGKIGSLSARTPPANREPLNSSAKDRKQNSIGSVCDGIELSGPHTE